MSIPNNGDSASMPTRPAIGIETASELEAELGTYHYKQELKRGLSLPMLTAYGLNWLAPLGPSAIFGLLIMQTGGTVALPYLLAGGVMAFTAAAYAVMVQNFPLTGSAYAYVSKGMSAYLGFLVGWVLMIDYLLFPAIATISSTYYAMQIFPQVPFWVFITAIALFTLVLNITGVELMAKIGLWLLVVGDAVVIIACVVWGWAAGAQGDGLSSVFTVNAFKFDTFSALMGATSLCVLNYLGFEATTTLAEEANNPRRDIPRSIWLTLMIGGGTFVVLTYFGSLMTQDWAQHVDDSGWIGATLYWASVNAAGPWFGVFFTLGWINVSFVFNVVSTAAASRLLYGMGRDRLLPKAVFGAINDRFKTPHWNIIIIISLIFIIAAFMDFGQLANLINFGGLIGYISLNAVVIWMYVVKGNGFITKWHKGTTMYYLRYLLVPAIGFVAIGYIFFNLGQTTLLFGAGWLVIGIVYLGIRTKGFRELPPVLEV